MVNTAPVEQIKYDNKIEEKSFGGLFRKFKKEKENTEENKYEVCYVWFNGRR